MLPDSHLSLCCHLTSTNNQVRVKKLFRVISSWLLWPKTLLPSCSFSCHSPRSLMNCMDRLCVVSNKGHSAFTKTLETVNVWPMYVISTLGWAIYSGFTNDLESFCWISKMTDCQYCFGFCNDFFLHSFLVFYLLLCISERKHAQYSSIDQWFPGPWTGTGP